MVESTTTPCSPGDADRITKENDLFRQASDLRKKVTEAAANGKDQLSFNKKEIKMLDRAIRYAFLEWWYEGIERGM